jgi:hypothetical protein
MQVSTSQPQLGPDIREVRIINEAIYVGIIAAGNAQTRPVIKKRPHPATLATPMAIKDTKRNPRATTAEHRS